jgi:hypothetical protein
MKNLRLHLHMPACTQSRYMIKPTCHFAYVKKKKICAKNEPSYDTCLVFFNQPQKYQLFSKHDQ